MIRQKLLFLLVFCNLVLVFNPGVKGQGIEEIVKNKNKRINSERKPILLPGIREADISWSKIVWRTIDFREKMNQQFYFPNVNVKDSARDVLSGRVNLINLLLKAIKDQKVTPFRSASAGEEDFSVPLSYDQVRGRFGNLVKKLPVRDVNDPQKVVMTQVEINIPTSEVKKLYVKEIWYFDKQKSSMQVRILGICPVREFFEDSDQEKSKLLENDLFWVEYNNNLRKVLASSECFNPFNSSRSFSFDDIFLLRMFDGYIMREENVYDNRGISDYTKGHPDLALKESDRIKNAIFNYEQDLWEY